MEPVHEEGEDGAVTVRYCRKPEAPSQKEWEDHMALHVPFRAWCPHCVTGQAVDEPHKRGHGEEEEAIPVVSIDYMWMKSKGDTKGTEEEDTKNRGMPILVIADTQSGYWPVTWR